ncbi:helix-turn-helix domain-containing protein [Mucilaginibacter endophyticus]|uniref:helix-turn-helix domain-containing protein n=1 Tax=Mucilaginibacter endophyticus TaxID=2675003 RepID=UPI000E0CE2E9|nr:helix-turn-helix domain-containing protein [Mucilaginibacter endophyticus]
MKTYSLGKKIKDLRNRKGLSQEALAEQAQISLRTVQRIESDETEARGDTLKRLAFTLDTNIEYLTQITDNFNGSIPGYDKSLLIRINLSTLSFILFPPLGIIIPLVLRRLNKSLLPSENKSVKRLINIQICWLVMLMTVLGIFYLRAILHLPGILNLNSGELMLLSVPIFYIVNVAYIILSTIMLYIKQQLIYKQAAPSLS